MISSKKHNSKITTFHSPIGNISISWLNHEVTDLVIGAKSIENPQSQRPQFIDDAIRQIKEYLLGTRKHFDIPLHIDGSEFQKKVWDIMCHVPYGEVISYGQVAQLIGNPKAFQAVGTACGKNRLPIIIPCHRIIAAKGKIGGFGAGIEKKVWLLELEKKNCR